VSSVDLGPIGGAGVRPVDVAQSRGALRSVWRRPTVIISIVTLAVLVAAAILAPVLPLPDPIQEDVVHKLAAPSWAPGGLSGHFLGTDQLGRDVLSRLVFGARVSLSLGLACTALSCLIGVPLGLLAGMRRGAVDGAIMAVSDVLLAFPFLVLAIAITAVVGSSFITLVLVLAGFGWVQFARLVRGDVLAVRGREFVESSRAIGLPSWRIATDHILPNVLSPVIVIATFTLAQIILIESALSFLGLGVQPPTPSWGGMLADGRPYIRSAWWIGAFPGLALIATVLAVNWLGDAMRDAFDPRSRT
jgi:peptide/nickel transport system permease protein